MLLINGAATPSELLRYAMKKRRAKNDAGDRSQLFASVVRVAAVRVVLRHQLMTV